MPPAVEHVLPSDFIHPDATFKSLGSKARCTIEQAGGVPYLRIRATKLPHFFGPLHLIAGATLFGANDILPVVRIVGTTGATLGDLRISGDTGEKVVVWVQQVVAEYQGAGVTAGD